MLRTESIVRDVRLGLRANWRQFTLLLLINAFVGGMVGLERTILPLMAQADFDLASSSAILSFLVSFGLAKALANLFAGRLSDRWGRRRVLIGGWLTGLPVPLILAFAPHWGWVIFANALLGINQGLCWSTTVIMKIDLAGPRRRGLAMGLNESTGYVSVALSALATGYLATTIGFEAALISLGLAFAFLGLLLSSAFVGETLSFARREGQDRPEATGVQPSSFAQIFQLVSWKDRTLFAASQAGLVNNLNDAMTWGLAPLLLAGGGLPFEQVAMIAALYPGIWGVGQLFTGALSDRWGRKWMIAVGMWVQAAGIGLFAAGKEFWPWAAGAALLGIGTALAYPTLLATVSNAAHPAWRATAVGVYRLWRDLGYAVGAVLAGILADLLGIPVSFAAVGALTFLSGVIVAKWVKEQR
jgi:MFS family permease